MIVAPLVITDWVHAECQNWALWSHQCDTLPHPLPPTRCGSLEAGYQSPAMWAEDDARRTPYAKPNERHAKIVQGVWERLPYWPRRCLKAEYVESLASRQVQGRDAAARRLGITLGVYEQGLGEAVKKVEEAFA